MCKYIYRAYILELELLGPKLYGFVILKEITTLPSTAAVPTYTLTGNIMSVCFPISFSIWYVIHIKTNIVSHVLIEYQNWPKTGCT